MVFDNKILVLLIALLFAGNISANISNIRKPGEDHRRILFILDASSSMTNTWNGNSRYEEASRIISRLVDSLHRKDPELEFSLRVIGAKHLASERNCTDTRVMVTFQHSNQNQIKQALKHIQPIGWSPINFALKAASNDDLVDFNYYQYGIILITDGEESCGGDICETVDSYLKEKFFFQPYIIGLDPDNDLTSYYQCIGEYLPLRNTSDENNIIKKVLDFKTYSPTKSANVPIFPAVTAIPDEVMRQIDTSTYSEEENRLMAERIAEQRKIQQKYIAEQERQRKNAENIAAEQRARAAETEKKRLEEIRKEKEEKARIAAEQKAAHEKAEKELIEINERRKKAQEKWIAQQRERVLAQNSAYMKAIKMRADAMVNINSKRLESIRLLEQQRLNEQKAKEEADRIAAEKAEKEKLAAEQKAKEEADRIAAEKAEQEKLAAEQKAKEEADRLAAEKAEQDRLAAEQKAKEEADRIEAEKAEQERIAAEKARLEKETRAKEEAARLAAEKAEQERLLAEQKKLEEEMAAEQRRLAQAEAKAKKEAEEKIRKEKERLAAEEDKAKREAEEKIKKEAEKVAAQNDERRKPSPMPTNITNKIERAGVQISTEESDKTQLKIYLRGSNGELYRSSPVMSLYRTSAAKPDLVFNRFVDGRGEPKPIDISAPGNYTITFGKDVTFLAKNVYIEEGKMNKVVMDVKPGTIRFAYGNNSDKEVVGYTASIRKIFPDKRKAVEQKTEERRDYTPGNYHITINTLPELELNVDVFEGSTSLVLYISEPGTLVLPTTLSSPVTLLESYSSTFKPFLQIYNNSNKVEYKLRPGMYQMIYQKDGAEQSKKFMIRSNEEYTAKLD